MTIKSTLMALETADLEALRNEWGRRYGAPPRLRSVMLVRHLLAWRIQADASGGLDVETRRLLRQSKLRREPAVVPGTIIVREWRGARHEVEAVEQGFLYARRLEKPLGGRARHHGNSLERPPLLGLRDTGL